MTDNIPCSKSFAQRYILAILFSKSKAVLESIDKDNLSDDVRSTIKLLDAFNVKYEFENNLLRIDATKADIQKRIKDGFEFNCGESGTLIRMLVPILASYQGSFTLTGSGSLKNRNLDSIAPVFRNLGVSYNSNNGKVPITVNSLGYQDNYIELELDGKETSQYISGMVMAACFSDKQKRFKIVNCKSFEYVKITVEVMSNLGYDIDLKDDNSIYVNGRMYDLSEWRITIEKDWSSAAAYLIEKIVEEETRIEIKNIDTWSHQIDSLVIDLVEKWYTILYGGYDIKLSKNKDDLTPFWFDCTYCPDLFPIVCALAATIKTGYSKVTGLDRLVNKESNRGQVIYDEFKKYGIDLYIDDNSLFIKGTDKIINAEYNSHNDHRIAMALLILRNAYKLDIPENDQCLSKSYPKFINEIHHKKIRYA